MPDITIVQFFLQQGTRNKQNWRMKKGKDSITTYEERQTLLSLVEGSDEEQLVIISDVEAEQKKRRALLRLSSLRASGGARYYR